MCSVVHRRDGEKAAREMTSVARLAQFVESSTLSFYQIASLIGISGTVLSMWLAGTARPSMTKLEAMEKLFALKEGGHRGG
jgi:transcriptional regulator with XRE-family HTH domain